MSAIMRSAGDGQEAFERFRRDAFFQRSLERRRAEHAVRADAGDGDADFAAALPHSLIAKLRHFRVIPL
jgi:hypothetical protein